MQLKLYNTLTRQKRVFTPLDPANVRMYVCGPTVYDFAHIGNARPVIVFDVLFRLLRHIYGAAHVTYVRNITDVDDKINARAAEEYPALPLNEAIRKVTEKTDRQFHEDVAALGCLPPNVEPRATEHIAEMKKLIERLYRSKYAYRFKNHMLFRVKGLKSYGKLSHRSLRDLKLSARGETAPKHDPLDFVLWKPSKVGEPSWPSPARIRVRGRPGWHIECSAMADKWLWSNVRSKLTKRGRVHPHQFDIHGGGVDLLFPHHENERAQSCCAFGTRMLAKLWMHNGFLQVEGEKMSKSLGNFITIRQLRENWHGYAWPGEAIRFNMLRTHYRQPMDWTYSSLDESHKILWEWYGELQNTNTNTKERDSIPPEFISSLSDDLNTPAAITVLHSFRGQERLNDLRSALQFLGFSCDLAKLNRHAPQAAGQQLPFVQDNTWDVAAQIAQRRQRAAIQTGSDFVPPPLPLIYEEEIKKLVAARNEARQGKNFAEADRIRGELAKMGVVVKDTKDGTTWEIAR
jgi:cysteinyl-tRNA synthetase